MKSAASIGVFWNDLGKRSCLWITSCGNVTTATSGPAGPLNMNLTMYNFSQHNIWQKLLVFSLRSKDIITVILDLMVFCRIAYIFTSKQLHIDAFNKTNVNGQWKCS